MGKEEEKKIAGEKAVEYVEDGQVVGLGSGSTVKYFFDALSKRIEEDNLGILGVPSSENTREYCESLGIVTIDIGEAKRVDIAVDGADEVDRKLFMIKGGGGSHTREKMIATKAKKFVVIVDSSKMVNVLGKFPVAVEVLQELSGLAKKDLEKLGARVVTREGFLTDNGNIIFDCYFGDIEKPARLEKKINDIEGVVDNGLFSRKADLLIVGRTHGVQFFKRK